MEGIPKRMPIIKMTTIRIKANAPSVLAKTSTKDRPKIFWVPFYALPFLFFSFVFGLKDSLFFMYDAIC